MTKLAERICSPVKRTELERRWAAVRSRMPELALDAIVIHGSANTVGLGGYFRWFTGSSPIGNHALTVIFPKDDLMTLVCHGPFHGDSKVDSEDPAFAGIGRRITTPAFPAVSYTSEFEAELVAREIIGKGYRRVGIILHDGSYYAVLKGIEKRVGNVLLIDATDIIDPIKAIKSDEEIKWIRRAAAMQDEVFERTRAFIKPGMHDFEVAKTASNGFTRQARKSSNSDEPKRAAADEYSHRPSARPGAGATILRSDPGRFPRGDGQCRLQCR